MSFFLCVLCVFCGALFFSAVDAGAPKRVPVVKIVSR